MQHNNYKVIYISMKLTVIIFLLVIADVKNLIGEPDYRKVQLHWETDKFNVPAPANFQIRYCELQSWGSQRCRTKLVDDQMNGEGAGMDIDGEDLRVYSTEIVGLRMATTYSFEVKMKSKGTREDRADGDDTNQNIIVIPTKGCNYNYNGKLQTETNL